MAVTVTTEVIKVNGKLMIFHPATKQLVPAPAGARLGQKVEISV